jgi:hypothetical protein
VNSYQIPSDGVGAVPVATAVGSEVLSAVANATVNEVAMHVANAVLNVEVNPSRETNALKLR